MQAMSNGHASLLSVFKLSECKALSYIFDKTNHGFQVKKNLIFQRLHQIRCIKNICTQFTRHVFAAFCLEDFFLLRQGLTLMRLCI